MKYAKLGSVRFMVISTLVLSSLALSTAHAQDIHGRKIEMSEAISMDKYDQLNRCPDDNSTSLIKEDPSIPWESNLRLGEAPVLEAQVPVGNTCFTPIGACPIFNGPLPIGAPCWCGSPVYGPFGRVGAP